MPTTIALIVEGEYDKAVLSVLAARCRAGVATITRICRGPVVGKLPGLLAEIERTHPRIQKVLVVSDADGRDPERLARDLKARLIRRYRFRVLPIVIVEAMEAWLIADPDAFRQVMGVRPALGSLRERIKDPKRQLQKLLPPTTPYTSELARRIAEGLDLNVLKQRCPRFVAFRNAVLGH
jgi:hypothetical protein